MAYVPTSAVVQQPSAVCRRRLRFLLEGEGDRQDAKLDLIRDVLLQKGVPGRVQITQQAAPDGSERLIVTPGAAPEDTTDASE